MFLAVVHVLQFAVGAVIFLAVFADIELSGQNTGSAQDFSARRYIEVGVIHAVDDLSAIWISVRTFYGEWTDPIRVSFEHLMEADSTGSACWHGMRWSKIAAKKEPEMSNHKRVTEREMKERAGRMLEKAVGGSGIEVENDIVLSAKTGELVEEIPPADPGPAPGK